VHIDDVGEIKPSAGDSLVISKNADGEISFTKILEIAPSVDIGLALDHKFAQGRPLRGDRRAPHQTAYCDNTRRDDQSQSLPPLFAREIPSLRGFLKNQSFEAFSCVSNILISPPIQSSDPGQF
jgi:hypothetical protein